MGEGDFRNLEDVFSRVRKDGFEGWERVLCKEMPGQYEKDVVGAMLTYSEKGLQLELWFQPPGATEIERVRVPMYCEGGIQIKIDVSQVDEEDGEK